MLHRLITQRQAAAAPTGYWLLSRGLCSAECGPGLGHLGDASQRMAEAASRNDLDGVLEVVEAAGEAFDAQAVEAALRQVESCTRDLSDADRQRLYGTNKTFQMLADMAVSSAGHATPQVLASTIGVLGRLGFADEMVLDSLARHLMPGVNKLEPGQLAQLVEGLKGADHSPSVLLLDEVHERLSEMQQSVPGEQAAFIKEGLQQLGRDEGNLPNPSDSQGQPDRIKYS